MAPTPWDTSPPGARNWTRHLSPSPNRQARIAGFLYLLAALFSLYSDSAVRAAVKVSANAAATAENIRGSETVFRLALAADLACVVGLVLAALALFALIALAAGLAETAFVLWLLVQGVPAPRSTPGLETR